uniref:RING-type E3 ubiquitin transferase n=1 Tax=Branchiostoma floridae TaxID=7739 RepID=C3XTL5_BRAFL|eukprot:XP_002612632.1 hypothetical protein BRAFLDRAFT_78740 [Branchiostoma floridae]
MAAASSSLGSHMREELSCSICLELFTRPKVLPCQHTFCQDCLRDLVGGRRNFQCPNCRRQVSLPGPGVVGLPDNHLVTNLCEALQNQATLSRETREQPRAENMCSFHPYEEIKLFCKQCNVSVCTECLDEMHSDHDTISMKKATQEGRVSFQELIAEGRNILATYSSFLEGLREQEITLSEQKQQTKDSINQAFNQMVQKLKKDKSRLLSQVNNKHSKNMKMLQKRRGSVLPDVRELSAACDKAEQELQQGGVKFLCQDTMLTEVVGKYRRKAAPTPVQIQSAVFKPTDTPVLGDVTFQSLPNAPTPAVPTARGTGYHHSNQGQSLPPAPISAALGSGFVAEVIHESHQQAQMIPPVETKIKAGAHLDAFGVAVSKEGEVFVADTGNQKIQVFTLQGMLLRQFPAAVSDELNIDPQDVALDGKGNLWVVGYPFCAYLCRDRSEYVVQYNKQGRVLRKFALRRAHWRRGIAVDTKRNHILVTQTTGHIDDEDNRRGEVLVFRPDGTLVRTVGQHQGMVNPWHIAVDRGNILLSDSYNHFIYVFDEDGRFLLQFGGEGGSNGQLKGPLGICTDTAGNIFVVDRDNSRVEMFDIAGRFLKHITTDIQYPLAVAMAPQGQLVVTDSGENNIHIIPPCFIYNER